eukprot:TRINITY_DN3932_c0_g1_i1.p1 TRINITY_DN3932_c0_g1~~TRINITY_DN3932_c0_g1_i1.p1  ORF type:complete len:943 (-),score=77.09 TRINITY_DN3932_c0_g1_i1:28-2856(-)
MDWRIPSAKRQRQPSQRSSRGLSLIGLSAEEPHNSVGTPVTAVQATAQSKELLQNIVDRVAELDEDDYFLDNYVEHWSRAEFFDKVDLALAEGRTAVEHELDLWSRTVLNSTPTQPGDVIAEDTQETEGETIDELQILPVSILTPLCGLRALLAEFTKLGPRVHDVQSTNVTTHKHARQLVLELNIELAKLHHALLREKKRTDHEMMTRTETLKRASETDLLLKHNAQMTAMHLRIIALKRRAEEAEKMNQDVEIKAAEQQRKIETLTSHSRKLAAKLQVMQVRQPPISISPVSTLPDLDNSGSFGPLPELEGTLSDEAGVVPRRSRQNSLRHIYHAHRRSSLWKHLQQQVPIASGPTATPQQSSPHAHCVSVGTWTGDSNSYDHELVKTPSSRLGGRLYSISSVSSLVRSVSAFRRTVHDRPETAEGRADTQPQTQQLARPSSAQVVALEATISSLRRDLARLQEKVGSSNVSRSRMQVVFRAVTKGLRAASIPGIENSTEPEVKLAQRITEPIAKTLNMLTGLWSGEDEDIIQTLDDLHAVVSDVSGVPKENAALLDGDRSRAVSFRLHSKSDTDEPSKKSDKLQEPQSESLERRKSLSNLKSKATVAADKERPAPLCTVSKFTQTSVVLMSRERKLEVVPHRRSVPSITPTPPSPRPHSGSASRPHPVTPKPREDLHAVPRKSVINSSFGPIAASKVMTVSVGVAIQTDLSPPPTPGLRSTLRPRERMRRKMVFCEPHERRLMELHDTYLVPMLHKLEIAKRFMAEVCQERSATVRETVPSTVQDVPWIYGQVDVAISSIVEGIMLRQWRPKTADTTDPIFRATVAQHGHRVMLGLQDSPIRVDHHFPLLPNHGPYRGPPDGSEAPLLLNPHSQIGSVILVRNSKSTPRYDSRLKSVDNQSEDSVIASLEALHFPISPRRHTTKGRYNVPIPSMPATPR